MANTTRRPFALWVIFGALVYTGATVIVLLLEGSFTGAPPTDPTLLPFLILAIILAVAGVTALTGKRWALVFALILAAVFLALNVLTSPGILTQPANPIFWIFISGIPALILALVFTVGSLRNLETGLEKKPYLATPHSAGGLLTVGLVGFAVGAVLVSVMVGPLVATILEDVGTPFDVSIVRNAALPNTPEAYLPGTVTIAAGTTLTWLNSDTQVHTVTSDTGLFDSGDLQPGQRFSYTFTEAGTYGYFCTPHPWMTGTVIVE